MYPTQLAKTSFDEILDLTAQPSFNFMNKVLRLAQIRCFLLADPYCIVSRTDYHIPTSKNTGIHAPRF